MVGIGYNDIMDKKIIRNHDITMQKVLAIVLAFTIILLPFSIWMLYVLGTAKTHVCDRVTGKRIEKKGFTGVYGGGVATYFFVTVGAKELQVSRGIYEKLAVGDYIRAGYYKKFMHYCVKL
jgi:hypothetical protein